VAARCAPLSATHAGQIATASPPTAFDAHTPSARPQSDAAMVWEPALAVRSARLDASTRALSDWWIAARDAEAAR